MAEPQTNGVALGFAAMQIDDNDQVHSKENVTACLRLIIKYSMTATAQVAFPLHKNFILSEVNASLLFVSHDVHKYAHNSFLEENKFFFVHVGNTEWLKSMVNPCSLKCGAHGPLNFETGSLVLGHGYSKAKAAENITRLSRLFESLRAPIHFKTLHIKIPLCFFSRKEQLKPLLNSLRKVKVHERLTITGPDTHVNTQLRQIATELGMQVQPVYYEMEMRGQDGMRETFHAEYVPDMVMKNGVMVTRGSTLTDFYDLVTLKMQYVDAMNDGRYGQDLL